MGRPRLGLGTYGEVRCYKTRSGTHRAEANYRDWDGTTRLVQRTGPSKRAATQRLKDHFLDRKRAAQGDLTRDSSFAEAGERWLAEVQRSKVGTTYDRYYSRLHGRLIPALGELRIHECSTGVFDRYLHGLAGELAPGTIRGYRAVCSAVMGYCVRMDVIPRNPVRDVARVQGAGKQSRGLTAEERLDLLTKLDADQRAVADDLPDLLRYQLGSGVRMGEALGLRWFRVDLDEGVVIHGDNLVREKGRGLVLHSPKTEAGFRVIPVPEFVLLMLRLRHPGEGFDRNPVFPNAIGGWRDPNATHRSIRKFRKAAGYDWFTSHVLRHTAATMLDQAGLQPREISGYLGHARPSFTQDRYLDRRQQSGAAARGLDAGLRPVRG